MGESGHFKRLRFLLLVIHIAAHLRRDGRVPNCMTRLDAGRQQFGLSAREPAESGTGSPTLSATSPRAYARRRRRAGRRLPIHFTEIRGSLRIFRGESGHQVAPDALKTSRLPRLVTMNSSSFHPESSERRNFRTGRWLCFSATRTPKVGQSDAPAGRGPQPVRPSAALCFDHRIAWRLPLLRSDHLVELL
jgi:hypothetical protein